MGEPRFGWDEIPLAYAMDTAALPVAWDELEQPMAVNVGNPHSCSSSTMRDAVPLDGLGPMIEHDPPFPSGSTSTSPRSSGDGIRLRTWERGAGLTLACGTGACATAVAAIAPKRAKSRSKVDDARRRADHRAGQPGEPIRMSGAATHVFTGEIDLEALA